ncbi:hypothetical protein DSO57_1002147 [Entomophthora muscae]|uniref:Uncharacterized protein n=1 Tax=Entomophthora muscae TaxID=34485 RepID=A0ACC2SLK3_9FUNG|nr:hypothetical protein DSO57_1002147 [Entomophthora muscae]
MKIKRKHNLHKKIRKTKARKSNEEQPTLMKFAKGVHVAEGAAGERNITTRNEEEVIECNRNYGKIRSCLHVVGNYHPSSHRIND